MNFLPKSLYSKTCEVTLQFAQPYADRKAVEEALSSEVIKGGIKFTFAENGNDLTEVRYERGGSNPLWDTWAFAGILKQRLPNLQIFKIQQTEWKGIRSKWFTYGATQESSSKFTY